MLESFIVKRDRLSIILVFFFFLLVAASSILGPFFRPPETERKTNKYQTLFVPEQIQQIAKISLKNKLGQFEFQRNPMSTLELWDVTLPTKVHAKNEVVHKIMESLHSIRIRKQYNNGEVDSTSFSLDNPVMSITLKQLSGEEFSIIVGLSNPLDNSSYIQVPEKKLIYHIDSIDHSLEALEFSSIVESRPFASIIPLAVEIASGPTGQKTLFQFEPMKKTWPNTKGVDSTDKIEKLRELKALAIIDNLSEQGKNIVEKAFKSPYLTLTLKGQYGQKFVLDISPVLYTPLTEIKANIKNYFLIREQGSNAIYVFSKEQLATLSDFQ